jgi:trehalose/maltose hydrolase-like predicted phosphorylase
LTEPLTAAFPESGTGAVAAARRFEAAIFEWDVFEWDALDRDVLARARGLLERLLALGFDLCALADGEVGDIDRLLQIVPRGPGSFVYCVKHGAEVYVAGEAGPELLWRRRSSPDDEEALEAAAGLVGARLAALGLETAIARDGAGRRRVDLVPLAERAGGADDHRRTVEARLRHAGIASLAAVVEIVREAAVVAGLRDPRVNADTRYVEFGLTDKTDALRFAFEHLARRGIRRDQTVVAGAGPGALGGGAERFVELLDDQLARREAGDLPEPADDPEWTVAIEGVDSAGEGVNETLLAIGDGRIGTRGTLVTGSTGRPPVVAAGLYAGDGPTEALAPCAQWNVLDAGPLSGCRRTLDLRTGTLRHELRRGEAEADVLLWSSLARPGTAALRARGDGSLLRSRAPLRAPEGARERRLDGVQLVETQAGAATVVAAASERGVHASLDRLASYGPSYNAALEALETASEAGLERLYAEHRQAWGARWAGADVRVVGDPELTRALRFSLFGLMASVGDDGEAAVGARGLSGPGYRGHVFWDSDVYVLPFLAATHPPAARAMIAYRLNRLAAARAAARAARRDGVRFPWESTLSGFDVTPPAMSDGAGGVLPIRTGTHEEHVTADIAWAVDHYLRWTGDGEIADAAGALFAETARYWASRIRFDRGGSAHIYGVIGPDEYHEPVDDSAFTNVMVRWNLRRAAEVCAGGRHGVRPGERESWLTLADALVDGLDPATGIYEEFAGWNRLEPLEAPLEPRPFPAERMLGFDAVRRTQIVKQADVVLLHHLVPEEVDPSTLAPNLDYYEPITSHGSSLSPAIHASLLARLGRFELALRYLRVSAAFDLDNRNKTTAEGLHVATMGGVWQAIVFGFAGCRPGEDALVVDPRIPPDWEALELQLRFRGVPLSLRLTPTTIEARADGEVRIAAAGGTHVAGPDGLTISL